MKTKKLTVWDIAAIEHALRRDVNNLDRRSLESLIETISRAKEIIVKTEAS